MIRRETFCDGRLVKEIDQIDVTTSPSAQQYMDGRHIWLLNGEEVQEVEADAFRIAWESAGGQQ
ncbi:hypothetical protein [Streptomyces decoyicus]|uniref:hypothetical protein n=1 Tax=Streptomyces decoyicus TaxID=249567 RepID=UPI002F90BD33